MRTATEHLPEEEIYNILMHGSNAIIRTLDGTILTWTAGVARTYGWSPGEAIGRISHELLKTVFLEPLNSMDLQLVREGFWTGQLLHTAKSGAVLHVQSVCTLTTGKDNRQYVVEVNVDITPTMLARESLVASEERLRQAQEVAHVGIWDWDAATDTSVCSDRWFAQYGRAPKPFGPRSDEWIQWVHPDDREAVTLALEAATRGETPYDAEYRVLWPDGQVRWLHAKAQIILNRQQCVRMIGANIDVTERKQFEERLQDINRSLQQSNEDLRQFTYAVGHDLKEPLRGVSGCSALLQKKMGGTLDVEGQTFLKYIVEGAARMRHMLDGLLEFAKASEQRLPTEKVSTNEVVAAAAENLRASILDSSAEIRTDSLPSIHANAVALTQVFQNLIGNGIKYRRADERPLIVISARLTGEQWLFAVTDNGIGFEPKHKDSIFQLFHRVDHRHTPGAGVGLAVARRIVERHGGSIWAESQPGVGSTFYFSLPRRARRPSALYFEASASG